MLDLKIPIILDIQTRNDAFCILSKIFFQKIAIREKYVYSLKFSRSRFLDIKIFEFCALFFQKLILEKEKLAKSISEKIHDFYNDFKVTELVGQNHFYFEIPLYTDQFFALNTLFRI